MYSPQVSAQGSAQVQGGPEPILYKSELCRSWNETGACRYGAKCQFAHGTDEIRSRMRDPKYKTKNCRSWIDRGVCSYGARCQFLHDNVESLHSRSMSTPNFSSINKSYDPVYSPNLNSIDPVPRIYNNSGAANDASITPLVSHFSGLGIISEAGTNLTSPVNGDSAQNGAFSDQSPSFALHNEQVGLMRAVGQVRNPYVRHSHSASVPFSAMQSHQNGNIENSPFGVGSFPRNPDISRNQGISQQSSNLHNLSPFVGIVDNSGSRAGPNLSPFADSLSGTIASPLTNHYLMPSTGFGSYSGQAPSVSFHEVSVAPPRDSRAASTNSVNYGGSIDLHSRTTSLSILSNFDSVSSSNNIAAAPPGFYNQVQTSSNSSVSNAIRAPPGFGLNERSAPSISSAPFSSSPATSSRLDVFKQLNS